MSRPIPRGPMRLGPFELDGVLGEGGMGTVWRGRHLPDGLPIAVKVIKPSLHWRGQSHERFAREVRAVASLHHPAVVHVLDLGVIDKGAAERSSGRLPEGSPWMVMELCSGGTLFDHRGGIGWPRIRPLLLTLLDALAHAHARGVIHRDIKPGNVLVGTSLDHRPGVKLTDFGIARVTDAADLTGGADDGFAGSPSYAAPEQLMGDQRSIGPWTDLYSLGCLAWTLTTGEPPYGSHQPLAKLVAAHVGGRLPDFEPFDPVPPPFVDWLHVLLARRPEQRFQRAADAAWALRELAPAEAEEQLDAEQVPTVSAQGRVTRTRLRSQPADALHTEVSTTSDRQTRVDVTALARTAAAAQIALALPSEDSGLGPGPAASRSRPPLPEDWRRPDSTPPIHLLGAGLGLYASRTVPLVGREAERDQTWGALHDVVREGMVRAVVVSGSAGVGKSRLVRWMGERAEELGAATVVRAIHGSPAGPADGLGPMIRRWLRLEGTAGAGLLAAVRRWLVTRGADDPFLGSAVAELVEPGSSRREDSSIRVDLGRAEQRWHALSALLDVAAADRPVLLWLDDVQWGPDALGLALHLTTRRSAERRQVLVVATARTDLLETASVEADRVEELIELGATEQIELGPLDRDEDHRLVGELLHLDDDLAAQVVERTAGNPLFALQLVGDWVRRRVLVASRDGFVPAEDASLDLPDDIHTLWRGRLSEALAGRRREFREALAVAAALGADVDHGLWTAAAPLPPERLEELAGLLLEHGLATPTPRGFAFVHGMARESILRSAAERGDAPRIHGRCADAMSALGDPASVAQRGRHLLAAGRHREAATDLWSAAEATERLGDMPVAAALLDSAGRALSGQGLGELDPEVLRLRLRRLDVRRHMGTRGVPLDDALRALIRDAREAGAIDVVVGAGVSLGRVLRDGGDLPEGTRQLRESHILGAVEGLDEPTARAAISLAWALVLTGGYDEAAELFGESAGLLGRLGNLEGVARSWHGLAEVHKLRGDYEQARHFASRGLETAEACGDLATAADACVHLAAIETHGDLREARRWLERARVAAVRLSSDAMLANILNLSGEVARKDGDLDAAEDAYREALAVFEADGKAWSAVVRLNLAMVMMLTGRFGDALAPLQRARASLAADGRAGLLEATDVMLLGPIASAGDEADLRRHVERVEASVGGWLRPAEECAQVLGWAAPIARRAGMEALAVRIEAIATDYAESLRG